MDRRERRMIRERERMERRAQRRKLVGPWRNIHGAVWLIGLAILAWKGWWFPGILVLIAISLVLEGILMATAPQAFEAEETAMPTAPETPAPAPAPSPAPAPAPAVVEHRAELLPSTCPNCSGPIRGHEVKWTGPQSADCPYCGSNLPMSKG